MKKQKSIIRTLTSRSFKSNKTRNLVAILAIVLTTLMFTSLFVLSQSMVKNLQDMNFQQAGHDSHLSSSTLTDEEMEKISSLDEGMTLFSSNEDPQYAKMINSVKLHQE